MRETDAPFSISTLRLSISLILTFNPKFSALTLANSPLTLAKLTSTTATRASAPA